MYQLKDFKYGFCSYYALAYSVFHKKKEVIFIEEYDEEMEKYYFVHMAILEEEKFRDALGTYEKFEDMMDFTDIEVDKCRWNVFDVDKIKVFIEEDMGFFDEAIYQKAIQFVE